ncbi:MAG: metallophosphoesterase, partial [Pseudonocardiaceae bacterium]
MNRLGSAVVGTAALAVAGTAYSAGIEVRRWTLRQSTLPVLPDGAAQLRILHISDLHMTPNQRSKQRWL